MADLTLAGDRMRMSEDADGNATLTFDDKGTGRVCGQCNLCCKLVPVPPLGKAAGQRCRHQSATRGCRIYDQRPYACRTWSCRWVSDARTAGMPRPDRCHYVIDLEYDTVQMTNHETGAVTNVPVLQVWIDPAFPQAHRAPELRAFLSRMAETYRVSALIRYDSRNAFMLTAPPLAADGEWHETHGDVMARDRLEAAVLQHFDAATGGQA